MGGYKSTFKLTIMTPDALLYENEVQSVFVTGDKGEYEILPYHYPVLGILNNGNVIIDWKESILVKFGIIRFFANDCIILAEQKQEMAKIMKKEEDMAFAEDKERQ